MPEKTLARIRERRPDRWNTAMVEEVLVVGFRVIHTRGLWVTRDKIMTATWRPESAAVVNLVTLAMACLKPEALPPGDAREDRRIEHDVLKYFVTRAAIKNGVSHGEHARDRYGKSRKWINGVKKRALKRVVDCLNDAGHVPAATVLGENLRNGQASA